MKNTSLNKLKLYFLFIACYLVHDITFGQVTLGPGASKFVIFTSVGAVGDNASAHSLLTGDVGTASGAITGFGNVNGVMHPGVDASTTACGIDLAATITQINAAPATLFPSGTMGSGVTFTKGIYSIPGNATLSLNLILDAGGDPSAQFIIKIGGTFATNANSSVILKNGALACNVFWDIVGLVNMASPSTMRGNIISGGAITIGSGDSLEGRVFSTNGAININGITAFTPIGCGSPILTGPAAPNLNSVVCYAIFSSIGALANTPITTSIGDVGNAGGGTITGWSAGEVTGILHPTGDASTMQCATDLSKLYDTLNAMVPDIQLLFPVIFGNNLVLTPHVYLMNSSVNGPATLTDSLYLDAQGDANAVFVFQIKNGSLTTSVNSRVKLINGAQAQNVFWMVDGAVSINNNSVFVGTIVVSAGAINLVNTGVVLNGRALTENGAITTQGVAVTMPPGCGTPPTINTQPKNDTVCSGNTASFSVAAKGTGLTYQWRKGSVKLTNGVKISGATSDTLTINPVSITDTASNYNVIITGTVSPNDTSKNVSLIVNTATILTTQPVNQTGCTGNSVSFSVAATGSGLTYQWRKGSVNLTNGVKISGVNLDTLKMSNVSITDTASNYNVIITGICSPNDTSKNVSLSVNTATVLATQPINQTACAGNSVSFSVAATGSGLTYQWRKGSVNLTNGVKISGVNLDTLKMSNVSITDTASNYNVIITGICSPNDTSKNVSLSVNTATVLATQPVNQTACAGNSVSFSVAATGSGLTYQWRKGSMNLTNGVKISGVNLDTLKINNASITDTASNYNVIITGICSPNDTSKNVSLGVNPLSAAAGTITGTATVCQGQTGVVYSIPVIANATGYIWTLPVGATITTGIDTKSITVSFSATAVSGNVTVQGSNSCGAGTVSADFAVTVNSVPVAAGTITGTAIVCQGQTNVIYFLPVISNATSYIWTLPAGATITTGTNTKSITVSFSATAVSGNITVQGSNSCGTGTVSANFAVTVNSVPIAAGGITGAPVVCQGQTGVIYSVPVIANATSYLWTLPVGATITAGANTNTITVDFSSNAVSGDITVQGSNSCGVGTVSANFAVTLPAPICQGQTGVTFSFPVIANATGYIWTLPAGATIIAGANTNTITVDFSSSAVSGDITVQGSNSCGTGAVSSSFAVTVNPTPVAIASSNSPVCAGSSINLTAQTVAGGTYHWTGKNAYSSVVQNPVILSATSANAGTYSLTISALNCTSNISNVPVIVNDCGMADLSIEKTVNNAYPLIGHIVVFTMVATNNGPDSATGVTITDILQSGYMYSSSTTTTGTYNPSSGIWTIGTLHDGVSAKLTITAIVNSTGNYVNTATITGNETDGNLSNNLSSVTTYPTNFFIPEGFSPNGDAINDLFVIIGLEYYPENSIKIFNRWGDAVYEASPYQNTWEGTSTTGLRVGGNVLPIGTYFYLLDLGDGSKVLKGTIYLNR